MFGEVIHHLILLTLESFLTNEICQHKLLTHEAKAPEIIFLNF